MKLTLTQVFATNKDKNGNQLTSKDGKPYTRMSIKANEYGDKWISGFKNKSNENWKSGDEVECIVEQKGEYLNFSLPKGGMSNEGMEKILNLLTTIRLEVSQIKEHVVPAKMGKVPTSIDYPENDLGDCPLDEF